MSPGYLVARGLEGDVLGGGEEDHVLLVTSDNNNAPQ